MSQRVDLTGQRRLLGVEVKGRDEAVSFGGRRRQRKLSRGKVGVVTVEQSIAWCEMGEGALAGGKRELQALLCDSVRKHERDEAPDVERGGDVQRDVKEKQIESALDDIYTHPSSVKERNLMNMQTREKHETYRVDRPNRDEK